LQLIPAIFMHLETHHLHLVMAARLWRPSLPPELTAIQFRHKGALKHGLPGLRRAEAASAAQAGQMPGNDDGK
jgi:hypothetical protein